MPGFCPRTIDAGPPGLNDPIAIIDVIIGNRELLLIEPPESFEQSSRSEHAGSRDCGTFARAPNEAEVTRIVGRGPTECMAGKTFVIAMHDAGVLNRAIFKIEPS